ncbi:MAG: saccharopine dehydrogenase C-terminal domain-containing protein [Eubacteriales bacterium]|jgi:saccharopine dehydrogenase (NAD+, L-lysine-forming)|nr:saccharopine dehydrogenase NADP-binding domain-containing protein [Bacillota bacterium]MBV1728404.1 saccharopine dehydrogenase NADP-binding domain-containing protein [Desulforudis sp.]MBV1735342.1 saccharopine dehydrogenase NADP-binding domain-containing protein [Desulforudis sp.]MDZ4042425.1 saccharopine dehydrogenase C-terminal domain-containing protein [Eubacteriales bacterium]MDZ7609016.1 saccharopine dehydrogenase C-terminal domain-containing protein [Eubacteriales bacterium]
MNLLILGMGGVGSVIAKTLAKNNKFDTVICADVNEEQVNKVVQAIGRDNFRARVVNAADFDSVREAARDVDLVINAVIPRFNLIIMEACLAAGSHYIDMASDGPVILPGRVDIFQQLALHDRFREAGLLALCCMGVDPGVTQIFARYLADEMDTVEEILVRDADVSEVEGYDFALYFSPDTAIEECLQPPLFYENGEFKLGDALESGVEYFDFPEPIGRRKVYAVAHEEVGTIPRNITGLKKCDFKYALSDQFVEVLKVLRLIGLDSSEPIEVKGVRVRPRDVVTSLLPNPVDLAGKVKGLACVGTLVRGTKDGRMVEKFMYTSTSHEDAYQAMQEQAVSYQTGIPVAVAAELFADGLILERGAITADQLDPKPFVERLPRYGIPVVIEDRSEIRSD